jgi:nicotinate-nucleotide adenylyltransferase
VRLGIFGGSFDPPHIGHLLVAVDAYEALELDRLFFVPTSVQPLKVGLRVAAAHNRLAMVRLLVGSDERFEVDATEIDRAGLSFTVDTLETFARRHPTAERFFLVGEDAMATFASWREPGRILELARLAIMRRAAVAGERRPALPDGTIALSTRLVDVSSTEIRERVRCGKSLHGFVPEPIADYIEAERLYR